MIRNILTVEFGIMILKRTLADSETIETHADTSRNNKLDIRYDVINVLENRNLIMSWLYNLRLI